MSSADGVKPTTLIIAVAAAIILTVVVLEYYGMLRHNIDKQALPVGDFKAMYLSPGDSFRLSTKPPEVRAECQNGYLVIESKGDPNLRGVLVDFKNRGVSCMTPVPQPAAPASEASSPQP